MVVIPLYTFVSDYFNASFSVTCHEIHMVHFIKMLPKLEQQLILPFSSCKYESVVELQ